MTRFTLQGFPSSAHWSAAPRSGNITRDMFWNRKASWLTGSVTSYAESYTFEKGGMDMAIVYVVGKSGNPLMPTERCGHVRILLKTGKAVVAKGRPFTIRLCYETPEITQELYGGTDPGRTNIGNAVTDKKGECVYHDHVATRNKDVVSGMTKRREKRRARRRGERLVRKRRAKKNGTISTKLENGRLIPGTKKPTDVNDIINQEARFRNRKKRQLITPSVKHLIETHLQQIDHIREILPVKSWCLEMNKFAFMQMEDGSVQGVDFQNGRMKGYDSVEEFVYARQNGVCPICGKPIDHYHHVVPRSQRGSDGPENIIGLCKECHEKVHKGELDIELTGVLKKYGALSILNQAILYIYRGLVERFGEGNVHICSGRDTKAIREEAGLEKDHDLDALCITYAGTGVLPKAPKVSCYEVHQFRRHDRAKINSQPERTYKLDRKTVAKNRKPRFEQTDPALSQWYRKAVDTYGKKDADRMLSCLRVKKSYRRYNNVKRELPGAVIRYNDRIGILTGQQNNGFYYIVSGFPEKLKAADCEVLRHNPGLVYM